MNLEKRINHKVSDFLESGQIESRIEEAMSKAIDGVVQDLFTGYKAPVKEVIQQQLESQMIPAIEKYDFSRYIVKLDDVLTDVLQNTTIENKTILENFKSFTAFEKPEKVTLSDIFEKYLSHVSENVDTSELGVEYDDEPYYVSPTCVMVAEEDFSNSWSSFDYRNISFSCDKDKEMNVDFTLSKWRDEPFKIKGEGFKGVESLRNLSKFEMYLINLSAYNVPIEVDKEYLEEDELDIEQKPEASFS